MQKRKYPTSLLNNVSATAAASSSNDSILIPTSHSTRKVSASEALAVIQRADALVKNIETVNPSAEPPFTPEAREPRTSFTFYIEQMRHPESYRPKKQLPPGANRSIHFNFQERMWETRQVNAEQGQAKPGATHTKKTATTLLPPDGKIHLFQKKYGVLLVWDINSCKIKPDFIYEKNIGSNEKKWVGIGEDVYNQLPADQLPTPTTLDAIRSSHKKIIESRSTPQNEDAVPRWNEIDCGLSANAVIAIAAPENDLLRRLNIQYRRLVTYQKLDIDVALLIITPQKGVQVYTETMQLQDLARAKILPPDSVGRDFYNHIIAMNPEIESKLPAFNTLDMDIFEAIRVRNTTMIRRILNQDPNYVTEIRNEITPIQLAANLKFWDCVIAIAETVHSVEWRDTARYGAALLCAAESNETDAAIALIKAGASFLPWSHLKGLFTKKEYYAVTYFIERNNIPIMEMLLKKYPSFGNAKQPLRLLSLALDYEHPEMIALLLGFDSNPLLEALKCAAKHKKWDAIFVSLRPGFTNAGYARAISELLPIAASQNNLGVQKKLIAIMTRSICHEEQRLIVEDESVIRTHILSESVLPFKSFLAFSKSMQMQKETSEKIVQIQQKLYEHLKILSSGEVSAKPIQSASFFGKVTSFFKPNDHEKNHCEQQKHQECALEYTIEALAKQLSSGNPLSQIENSEFEPLLHHISDKFGMGKRTISLINEARELLKMPCEKIEAKAPIAASASASAAAHL